MQIWPASSWSRSERAPCPREYFFLSLIKFASLDDVCASRLIGPQERATVVMRASGGVSMLDRDKDQFERAAHVQEEGTSWRDSGTSTLGFQVKSIRASPGALVTCVAPGSILATKSNFFFFLFASVDYADFFFSIPMSSPSNQSPTVLAACRNWRGERMRVVCKPIGFSPRACQD